MDGRRGERQPGGKFSWVSSGRKHTCGVQTSDDQVVCWGYDRQRKASPPG